MTIRKIIVLAGAALLFAALAFAEKNYYKVLVSRVDQDVYRVEDVTPKVFIFTQHCHEHAIRANAVLIYDQWHTFDNKLVFENGGACRVEAVR